MEWEGGRESANVEDQRGAYGGGGGFGFGGGGFGGPVLFHGGIGSLILLFVVSWLFGVNPLQLMQGPQGGNPGGPAAMQPGGRVNDPAQDRLKRFVAVVLADTEDVWHDQFQRM